MPPLSNEPTSKASSAQANGDVTPTEQSEDTRFSPEEEAALLAESHSLKQEANILFASGRYSEAIQQYDKAIASCPTYLEYETAVLRSNIAACHIKLADWKGAIAAATQALEGLERMERESGDANAGKRRDTGGEAEGEQGEEQVEDIVSPGAERIGALPTENGPSKEDISRIKAKALMRRAKARTEAGGWSALAGAEEGKTCAWSTSPVPSRIPPTELTFSSDYKAVSSMMSVLQPQDRKIITRQLSLLPTLIDTAKQKEMGEMMGKLKELGNGILKPFGLSTDNFNMVKDEATGGYSMQFNQGGSK